MTRRKYSRLEWSSHIKARAIHNLVKATDCACHIGQPFTRLITINLQDGGISATNAHHFITRFFRLQGDWLAQKGVKRTYLWVLENPRNSCLHLHALIFVPPVCAKSYEQRLLHWALLAGCRKSASNMVDCERIGKHRPPAGSAGHIRAIAGALKYVLKGGAPAACVALGIHPAPQGLVLGKRCGTSETIGALARSKFKPLRFYVCEPAGTPASAPPDRPRAQALLAVALPGSP